MRTFLNVAIFPEDTVRQLVVSGAFLFARSQTVNYLELPAGHKQKNGKANIWATLCTIYDLKNSPKLWFSCLIQYLEQQGYRQHEAQPCIYFNQVSGEYPTTLVVISVDNILYASRPLEAL